MSTVLEHIQQEEPTEDEIAKYAEWLELDPEMDGDLMWIAREGLRAELPSGWRPCRTDEGDIYYFNFETGQSMWDHPQDKHYKEIARKEKAKKAQRLEKQRREEKKKQTEKTLGIASNKSLGSNLLSTKKPLGSIKPIQGIESEVPTLNQNKLPQSISSLSQKSGTSTTIITSVKPHSDLKSENKEANKELKKLKKNIQLLREEELELKENIQTLNSSISELTKSNKELKIINKELKQSNNELKETNNELNGELKFISQKRKRLASELQEIEDQAERREKESKSIEQQNQKMEQSLSDLQLIIESLTSKKEDLQTELKELNEELQQKREEILAMKQQTKVPQIVASSKKFEDTGVIDASSFELSTSFQQNDYEDKNSIEQEKNLINRQIIDLKENLSLLTLQLNEDTLKKKNLEQLISTLTLQKQDLNKDCINLKETRQSVLDSLDTLKKKIEDTEDNYTKLQNEISTLLDEKREILQSISELKGEESRLKIDNTVASSSQRNTNTSNTEIPSKLEFLQLEIVQKEKELDQLKKQIKKETQAHQSNMLLYNQEISKIKNKVIELEERKFEYSQEIESLEEKKSLLQKQYKDLKLTLESKEPKNVSEHSSQPTTKKFQVYNDEESVPDDITRDMGIDDNLLSLITTSLGQSEQKKKIVSTVQSQLDHLKHFQEFVNEEKKQIRIKKQSLEKARNEWKLDHDERKDSINEELLQNVKQILDHQAQEMNQNIEQLNRIQSYITLRKKQLKLFIENGTEEEPDLLFYKRNQTPKILPNPKLTGLTKQHQQQHQQHQQQLQQQTGDHKILKDTLNRLKEDIDQLHYAIEKENISPKSTQDVYFKNKWSHYFEEQRVRYGGRVWDFQDRIRKWTEAISKERNMINDHELWLKNFRRELKSNDKRLH